MEQTIESQQNMKNDALKALNKNKAITLEGVARNMGYDGPLSNLETVLAELQRDGYLVITKKNKYASLEASGLVRAAIVTQAENFSFARPSQSAGRAEDIFIGRNAVGDALYGDTVLIERGARGGRVVRVVQSGSHRYIGKIQRRDGRFVVPPTGGIRMELPVIPDKDDLSDGQIAQLELVRMQRTLYARAVRVYQGGETAAVCSQAVIDSLGIPVDFSTETLQQADGLLQRGVCDEDLHGRLDLRDTCIFTIDGADAKDLDDAVSITSTEDGWQLGVHIADVSHYVTAGSALDVEARARGTSVYYADQVIPMLPAALSNGICSLNPNEDRLAFSALIDIDSQGRLAGWSFRKSVIRSCVKGVYSEINTLFDLLDGAKPNTESRHLKKKYAAVYAELPIMRACAAAIDRQAILHGKLELESTESEIITDGQGRAVDVVVRERGEAERLIESFMVVTNEAAASLSREATLPFVYRVHASPASDRIEEFSRSAAFLGLNPVRLSNGRPSDFQALLEQAKTTRYAGLVSDLLLRCLAKAEYSPENSGHFGLALKNYCHFTSPIRRYPDMAIHRILTAYCAGKKPEQLERKFTLFAQEASRLSSDFEVRAVTAERNCESCYIAEYMSSHLGEEFEGLAISMLNHGIYVRLSNTVEGLVKAEELPNMVFDGQFSYRGGGKKLTVGDTIRVRVARTDVFNGQVDFVPIRPSR